MKKKLVLWGFVMALAAPWGALSVSAQAVYYHYGGQGGPPPVRTYGQYGPWGRVPAPVATPRPFVKPAPRFLYKWEEHKRWLDWDQTIRSPLNPESDLDYMMRSF